MERNDSIVLSNGITMPPVVMSTFGLDYTIMKPLVLEALDLGVRAFDTARKYGNEDVVGRVLAECLQERGLSRSDVFITTKIFTFQQAAGKIKEEADVSLRNLNTDYIDLWLIHWPCPEYYLNTWKQMSEVYLGGKVKSIGLANPQVRHLETISREAPSVPLHCVQIELHPFRTCKDVVSWCNERGVAIQSYTPLCKMIPKVRDCEMLQILAKRHSCTLAQLILSWHFHKRFVPVFSTRKTARVKENLLAFNVDLCDDEIQAIDALNEDYKLLLESIYCPGY